eukprot:scaffold117748_cov57-Phaeocystis_antarctica.AAC.2
MAGPLRAATGRLRQSARRRAPRPVRPTRHLRRAPPRTARAAPRTHRGRRRARHARGQPWGAPRPAVCRPRLGQARAAAAAGGGVCPRRPRRRRGVPPPRAPRLLTSSSYASSASSTSSCIHDTYDTHGAPDLLLLDSARNLLRTVPATLTVPTVLSLPTCCCLHPHANAPAAFLTPTPTRTTGRLAAACAPGRGQGSRRPAQRPAARLDRCAAAPRCRRRRLLCRALN